MKKCTKCKEEKALTEFYMAKRYRLGVMAQCKACHYTSMKANRAANIERARQYDRDAYTTGKAMCKKLRDRMPRWADKAAILRFYDARPPAYQVDHIIPLNGETVSGLHVLANLQYLTPSENRSKGNKWQYTE